MNRNPKKRGSGSGKYTCVLPQSSREFAIKIGIGCSRLRQRLSGRPQLMNRVSKSGGLSLKRRGGLRASSTRWNGERHSRAGKARGRRSEIE